MAEALKAEGDNFFMAKDYEGAVQKYTEAIAIDPEVFLEYFFTYSLIKISRLVKQVLQNHIYYSNRSAAFLKLNKPIEALEDAVKTRVKI